VTTAAQSERGYGGVRPPWLTLAVAVVIVGVFAAGPATFDALVFDRAAIASGEAWRVLTGHLVHVDTGHLILDLAALVVLGGLVECAGHGSRPLLVLLGAGAGVVTAALWVLEPDLARYCGISGVLNTLYVGAALMLRPWLGSRWAAILIAADGAKIAVEAAGGTALFSTVTWPPVPLAHAAGACAGLVAIYLPSVGPDQPPTCSWSGPSGIG